MDVTRETLLYQVGQVTEVVHMRLGDYNGVQRFRIKGEIQIVLLSVCPASLEKPAIQQYAVAVDIQQVP